MAQVFPVLIFASLIWICGVATGAVGMGLWLLYILNRTTEEYLKKAQKKIEDLVNGEGEEWKKGKGGGLTDEDYRKLLGE